MNQSPDIETETSSASVARADTTLRKVIKRTLGVSLAIGIVIGIIVLIALSATCSNDTSGLCSGASFMLAILTVIAVLSLGSLVALVRIRKNHIPQSRAKTIALVLLWSLFAIPLIPEVFILILALM